MLRQPQVGLEAIVVVDNVACGPAIGGVRMAADVTIAEVLVRATDSGLSPRAAAIQLARARVKEAIR